MIRKHWLEQFLEEVAFGPSKRGERAYDKPPKFKSTYPKGYDFHGSVNPEGFNDWIRNEVYDRRSLKRNTSHDR